MANNDLNETIETYKQAIREKPNDAEAHFNLGMAYINLERWNEAADAFKSAVKIKNDYDEALRKLGVVYKNLGYLNEAIVVYERALRLKPNNARTYAGLGSVYCKLKCWDKAVEAYKQAIKIDTEYAFAYFCLGNTYHLCRNLDEAVKTLEHAIQLLPNDVELYILLGEVYSDQEEWDKAIGIYKQAIRIEPNCASAYSDLGFVYNSLKNWSEAIKAYKQAIDLEPEEYLNYFILGNAYWNYGQLDEATKNIERAIQLKSNDADLYNTLGNIYGDLEQWDKAIGAYEQAIRITPEDVHVRFSLAFAFSHLKRCDDAIVAFKDIVRIKPDDVNAHYMLGLEYFSLNNLDSAMHEYRILKELDRDKANKLFKLINPDGKESPQKKESDRENFKELLSTGVRLDEEVNFLKEEPEEVIADEETRDGKISHTRAGGPPKLEISNSIFNFHDLRAGSTITDTLTISNAGGGALSGSVKTDKKGIIKHIKESVESLYNHCNKLEYVNNIFSTLLATHEKQEQARFLKEFTEKEKGLQDAFLLKKEELKNTYNRNTKNENLHYEKIMDETNSNLAQMEKEHRAEWLAWEDTSWKQFAPIKNLKEPPLTRFGALALKTRDKNNTKTIPALLRLITSKNLILNASGNDKNAAIIALQSIMLRLLVTIPPGKVNFILIDPVGLGSNMAGFMHLPEELVGGKIWTEPNHIEQQLVDLSTHMETIIQKYLRNNFSTMEEYNKEAGEVAEPYRFLVITNFPANFTEAAAQRLVSIASNGPRTGVYVIIVRDTALKLPYNFVVEELERLSTIIECKNGGFVWNDDTFKNHHLVLDRLPSTDLFNHLLKLIGEESKLAGIVQVPFEMALKEIKNWWGFKSDEGLSIPIGRAGARRLQYFSLGKGTLQHVLIGGKTGSGKSNLLHIIILGLCIGYSPDELELYLIDFKKGIEFKSYATMYLPHARVIAIQSEREFGLSVLQGLDAELQKRGDLFRNAGVQNLKEFRLKDNATSMRRIVLLVDEFQEFFTEDDAIASQSALLFDRLVRQGRAFGIHVILASQALAGTYTISSSTTDQMAIRIALQCSEADSRLILGEDNPTARLLSRPGEAVYNDANGLIEGNSLFQILYLSDEDREKYLKKLHNLYNTQRPNAEPHQIVFEGNAPASIERNKILGDLVNAPDWCGDSTQLQAWLGEPIAIKAHTAAVFKRQSRANLMVIGQSEESGSAMLISSLIGLAAQRPPDSIEFHILDLSNTDSPWNKTINSLPNYFNHKIAIYTKRHVNDAIETLFSILKEREASESGHKERSIFFFVFGLPRAKELKSSDGYTYPDPTNNLFAILSNGPDFGIHTICWGDTFKNVEKILGRNISEFDFRVATQMSINESNELIDSPAANKLGQYRALFYDEEKTGKLEKFRPYALPSSEWLSFVSNKLKISIKREKFLRSIYMQEGSNQFNQIYEVLRQYQNKLINMQEEGNHQFNQMYLETIKKFLETENQCYEKVGALNKEFESEATRLTNSHNSNLQDLQKKKDIEISGLHDRTLELAKKANDLVVLAKQSEEGATNYLSKFSYLKDILPAVKSEQSCEDDLKTDNSLDALMATISELAHTVTEDEKTVKGAVYKLLLFRKRRAKGRTIIFATAPVVVILAVFAVSMYNLHLLYNGYKRANTALEQKNWGLVNAEIEKLSIARSLRKRIMQLFPGEDSYNRILKTIGISESNVHDIKFTLLQREVYYHAGMEAYNAQNWQEATNMFTKIEQFDKVSYSSLKFPEQYASNIVEYQKERGLEYFDDTATLLNKSQSQYDKINENK